MIEPPVVGAKVGVKVASTAMVSPGGRLVLNMRVEQLEQELSRINSRPQLAAEQRQEARPTKRIRTGTERRGGGIGRSVATAAGYTTLGAALAWAALAYAL